MGGEGGLGIVAHPEFSKRKHNPGGLGAEGVWGRSPPPQTNFCGFHIQKTLILAHFLSKKDMQLMQSPWTMQKYFRSIMSKPRGFGQNK